MKNITKVLNEVFECDYNSELFFNEDNENMTVDFVSQGILCITLDIPQIIDRCRKWALTKEYIFNYKIKINPNTYTHIMSIEHINNKEIKIYDKELNEVDLELEYKFIFLACNYIIDKEGI